VYHNLILEGDNKIDAAPAPVLPHAPSQYTSQGNSCVLSTWDRGSIQSATKLAKIYGFIALRFSKSTVYSESSVAHLPILLELSLFLKMLCSGWSVSTLTV
jgi:hypothetical protein